MKINFFLRVVSYIRINLFVAVEEFVFVGNVYVIKLSLEKCMENIVKRMIFFVYIIREICVRVSINIYMKFLLVIIKLLYMLKYF